MKKPFYAPSLSSRILGMLIISVLTVGWAITVVTEQIIEKSILEQIRKQAVIYLYDVEEHLNFSYQTLEPDQLTQFLSAQAQVSDYFDFRIFRIFAFDLDGNIIASSHNSRHKPKQISPELRSRLLNRDYHIVDEIEHVALTQTQVTDIVIPLQFHGQLIGGLELEIDLEKTIVAVKSLDDNVERSVLKITAISTLTLLILLGALTHWGLISPINHFKEVTRKIAANDLSVRSNWRSTDELGELSGSINEMADNLQRLITQQEQAYLQVLQTLAKALEARDPYTASHSSRVTRYALKLAKELGLDEQQREILKQGALMHDLGKIGIPDDVLNKPAPLTEEEMQIMRSHPSKTAKILSPLSHMKEHAAIATWHHERWDGEGYPDGLKGEQIPLLARIVSIADTWDAMTGDRIYRKGFSYSKALDILLAEKDQGQFDPQLLDTFSKMIQRELEENDAET